jgi:hypothetical protein
MNLEERVEVLERELQAMKEELARLKQRDPHVVEAPFVVRDESGRGLFQVDTNDRGQARLALVDQQGGPAIGFNASEEGGFISVFNPDGSQAAAIFAHRGSGNVTTMTPDAREGASLFGSSRAGGGLKINNPEGHMVVAIGCYKDGTGQVLVCHPTGEVARLHVDPQGGTGALSLMDRNNKPVTTLPEVQAELWVLAEAASFDEAEQIEAGLMQMMDLAQRLNADVRKEVNAPGGGSSEVRIRFLTDSKEFAEAWKERKAGD